MLAVILKGDAAGGGVEGAAAGGTAEVAADSCWSQATRPNMAVALSANTENLCVLDMAILRT
jgi:hypothetical protein